MKVIISILSIIFLQLVGCAQPNTKTKIEFGIVNPQPDKTYKIFAEIKTDTASSRLTDGMDYLDPNVNDLAITLSNYNTNGDTLFGEYAFADKEYQQFIKAGLVQVNNNNLKYSAMTVTNWVELDKIEPKPGGFFIRKKE